MWSIYLSFPATIPPKIFYHLGAYMIKERSITNNAFLLCILWRLVSNLSLYSVNSFLSSPSWNIFTQEEPWLCPWFLGALDSLPFVWCHLFSHCHCMWFYLFHSHRLGWGSLTSYINCYCKSLTNIPISLVRHQMTILKHNSRYHEVAQKSSMASHG